MTVPRAARFLDWAVLLCLAAAVAIDLTGGFEAVVGGMRWRARSADRPFVLALGVLCLRLLLDRRTPAPDWLRTIWRWVQRHTADDEVRHARPLTPSVAAWKHHVLAATGIVAFGAVMLRAQLAHMDSVPDLGDPLFSIWRIGWVFHQLAGDSRGLFDANIFYPAPLALTYSDSMLLPSLLGAAPTRRPASRGRVTMLIASFGLSAFACYWLTDRSQDRPRQIHRRTRLWFLSVPLRHCFHFELLMTCWIPLRSGRCTTSSRRRVCLRRRHIHVHSRAILLHISGGVFPLVRRGPRVGAHRRLRRGGRMSAAAWPRGGHRARAAVARAYAGAHMHELLEEVRTANLSDYSRRSAQCRVVRKNARGSQA
jgi:hypothetical protein